MPDDWQARAHAEIASIKAMWAEKYGWSPEVVDAETIVDLLVHFRRRHPGSEPATFLLRLRYESDFETAGRREMFVNPNNPNEEGPEWWPKNVSAFKIEVPPRICLEGTYGFHSHLHRDRDGRRANLNRLLMEIERCLNPK